MVEISPFGIRYEFNAIELFLGLPQLLVLIVDIAFVAGHLNCCSKRSFSNELTLIQWIYLDCIADLSNNLLSLDNCVFKVRPFFIDFIEIKSSHSDRESNKAVMVKVENESVICLHFYCQHCKCSYSLQYIFEIIKSKFIETFANTHKYIFSKVKQINESTPSLHFSWELIKEIC